MPNHTGPSTPQKPELEACPLRIWLHDRTYLTISRIATGPLKCVHMQIRPGRQRPLKLQKNCEESDMAILAMGNLGHYVNRPVTPGSHAVNLVLQILETR